MKGNYLLVSISAIFGITLVHKAFNPFVVILAFIFLLYVFLRFSKIVVFVCSVCILFFMAYYLLFDLQNQTSYVETDTFLKAKFITSPDMNGDTFSALIKTSTNEKMQLNYTIKSESEKKTLTNLQIGMSCNFSGEFTRPNESRNLNAFNYKNYLYKKKIHWIYRPDSIPLDKCYQRSLTIYERLLLIRQAGINYIDTHFPEGTKGIVQALVYGERKQIDVDILASYQTLGLVHLLAISGLHVGLLTGAIYYFGIRMGLTREATTNILLLMLPFYVVLAGGAPSVIRASLMLMILLGCIRWQKILPIDAISITFLVMLLANPYNIFEVDFQLSFVVSLSLILSSTIIKRITNRLFQLATVSTIAQLCSLPILIYYFYEISLLSIPLNVLFVPVYSIIVLPLAILTLGLHFFIEPIGNILLTILDFALQLLNEITIFGSSLSTFTLTLGRPNIWLMMSYLIVIIALFVNWEKAKKIRSMTGPVICLVVVLAFDLNSSLFNPYGQVTIIDIGQGDSILIELPFNKGNYLIDTGPGLSNFKKEAWQEKRRTFDTGKDILIPFLKSKGIRTIDKLIITHGDMDHIGNGETILDELHVLELIIGDGPIESELEKKLLIKSYQKKVRIKTVKRSDGWVVDEFAFQILSPTGREQSENDRSIVILTSLGDLTWLFTGDLEEQGEKDLVNSYPNLSIDVLKVGHHGSRSSSSEEFLNQIKPKIAVISAGVNNRYNHPSPDVIKRLEDQNSIIFRTDLHGAIQYKFKKDFGTFKWILP